MTDALASVFSPTSVAIVGASERSPWTDLLLRGLEANNFPGPVHLVAREHRVVLGRATIPRLAEIDPPVDVAYVVTSHAQLPTIVAEASDAGVLGIIALASGFSETGRDGEVRQQELQRQAGHAPIRVLGPNSLGFINTRAHVCLFPPITSAVKCGSIAVLSQSGGIAANVAAYLDNSGQGISHLITTGNEALVTMSEVLAYLAHDEHTEVVAMFIESIRDPERFLAAAELASQSGKVMIALKVGSSQSARRAALAHTGALTGDDRVIAAAFARAGIVQVDSLEGLAATAVIAAHTGRLKGRSAGVLAISGGACALLADTAESKGIALPEFSPAAAARLARALPSFATIQNPLDITGAVIGNPDLLAQALSAVDQEPLDIIVCQSPLPPENSPGATPLAGALRKHSVPVIACSGLAALTETERATVHALGIPFVAGGFDQVVRAVANLMPAIQPGETADREAPTRLGLDLGLPPRHSRTGAWGEIQARGLLVAAGVPVVPAASCDSEEGAVASASRSGYPVALKGVNNEILHKTAAGLVHLDLGTEAAVRRAFREITRQPDDREETPTTALLSPMRPPGFDLLVGVTRHDGWGLALTVGVGGVLAEEVDLCRTSLLPVAHRTIFEMLRQIDVTGSLRDTIARSGRAIDDVADIIVQVSELALALAPDMEALEINPLRIWDGGVEALDALVIWKDAQR